MELEEIGLQIPKHDLHPQPVPVYTQICITIPCTSPQLDSLGSSPKSDYSSYSSSSGKQPVSNESVREKVVSDIRNLTPKLKNVNLSDKQSPRMNYMVNNVQTIETKETLGKTVTNSNKKVTSQLFIPIYEPDIRYNSDCVSNSDSAEDDLIRTTDISNLPDNLTFSNQTIVKNPQKRQNNNIHNEAFKETNSNKNSNKKSTFCNVCNFEITR